MLLTSEAVLEKVGGRTWFWSLVLALAAAFVPFLIHNQWITGPLVNAVLIIVLFLSGRRLAMVIAFVPSLMALSGGLLPLIAAPLVPIIILSNLVFIASIDYFYHRFHGAEPYWPAVVFGSLLKFAFLSIAAKVMVMFMNSPKLEMIINTMFSWPQLFSALLGGIVAFAVLK